MKKLISSYGISLMLLLLLSVMNVELLMAQGSSCVNRLAPCLSHLNGSRDIPDSCCDPLKSLIKSNPECLCSMISNKQSQRAKQAGINVTEAQQLPGKCGQHINPLECLTDSPNSKNSVDQDSSAAGTALWFDQHSQRLMVALVLSTIIIPIFWVSN